MMKSSIAPETTHDGFPWTEEGWVAWQLSRGMASRGTKVGGRWINGAAPNDDESKEWEWRVANFGGHTYMPREIEWEYPR